MSDRLDVVVVEHGAAAIHHQRWGATALFDMLVGGPERATTLARTFEATSALDDLLAGCIIDHDHSRLVVAGPADVISAAGARRVQEQEVLDELAPFWPGWTLEYEPAFVVEPIALYVRARGLPLASFNEPHAVADALGEPRFEAARYRAEGTVAAGTLHGGHDPTASIDSLELSVRAANELANAGFETVGQVLALDEQTLALRGLSQRTIREL